MSDESMSVLFGEDGFNLKRTDPEYVRLLSAFAFEEVPQEVHIPDDEAALAVLASLAGADALAVFSHMLPLALDQGVMPLQIREMLYQGTAYLGLGRILPFLLAFNAHMGNVPLGDTGTASPDTRVQAGEDVQVEAFGEGMRGFSKGGERGAQHLNRWMSGNCFGDYYTRGGLDLRQREMCTFCFIAGLGGCEPQLTTHAVGNMNVGNSKSYLISVISVCVPYIGYPRSLNALRCVNQAALQHEQQVASAAKESEDKE